MEPRVFPPKSGTLTTQLLDLLTVIATKKICKRIWRRTLCFINQFLVGVLIFKNNAQSYSMSAEHNELTNFDPLSFGKFNLGGYRDSQECIWCILLKSIQHIYDLGDLYKRASKFILELIKFGTFGTFYCSELIQEREELFLFIYLLSGGPTYILFLAIWLDRSWVIFTNFENMFAAIFSSHFDYQRSYN